MLNLNNIFALGCVQHNPLSLEQWMVVMKFTLSLPLLLTYLYLGCVQHHTAVAGAVDGRDEVHAVSTAAVNVFVPRLCSTSHRCRWSSGSSWWSSLYPCCYWTRPSSLWLGTTPTVSAAVPRSGRRASPLWPPLSPMVMPGISRKLGLSEPLMQSTDQGWRRGQSARDCFHLACRFTW